MVFYVSGELIEKLFKNATSWKDVLSLCLVSKQFLEVGQQLVLDLPCTITDKFDENELPLKMAQSLVIVCNAKTEEAFIDRVVKSFKNCLHIILHLNDLDNLFTIKKISKIIVKNGITLQVKSPHRQEVHDAINNLVEKYDQQNSTYYNKQNKLQVAKRKRSSDDFDTLLVPKDPKERHKFLLDYLLHDNCLDSSPPINDCKNPFKKITNDITYTDKIATSLLFTSGFDEALPEIKQFVNCIIRFDKLTVLVTSFDVFHHNNKYLDDCAQPGFDIEYTPLAKIHSKTYTDKKFTEVSICVGHYEFLVVAGIILKNEMFSPFLGSSLEKFKFEPETTHNIKIPLKKCNFIRDKRLLNQYIKRQSHKLWGIRSLTLYYEHFYPITPVNFLGHTSQQFKNVNNSHFASAGLNLITQPNVITKEDINNLWSLLIRAPLFQNKSENSKSPISFVEFEDILKKNGKDTTMYQLIKVIGEIEQKTPCFFLGLHDQTSSKKLALDIMKSNLKNEIKNQHTIIINKIKELL